LLASSQTSNKQTNKYSFNRQTILPTIQLIIQQTIRSISQQNKYKPFQRIIRLKIQSINQSSN